MAKILVCDDQLIVCEGLKRILESDKELQVIGIANDGQEALELSEQLNPDLVLMDLKMPVMNGVVATRRILQKDPNQKVLILTTYDDDEWIMDAVRAGASGYLLKDTPPAELLQAIHGTLEGKSFVDPNITGKLLNSIKNQPAIENDATHFNLTDREIELLSMMAQGLTNAEIARQLYLSEGTVRNYISEVFRKLGVSDRTQAVIVGLRHGLVNL